MIKSTKHSTAVDGMRQDWNERARQDPFLYIASWRKDWDETSFFASGEADYNKLVEPVLRELALDPNSKSMAEIGCGAGRMTRSFAGRFHSVIAVDISEEMQARGKAFLSNCDNITWICSEGQSLGGLRNCSVDFVFSYLVLQHFPSRELVAETIHEMIRALKPGGAYLFQFNGYREPTMNWKGRLLCSCLDSLASFGLKRLSSVGARLAGIDQFMVGKTWRGVALTSSDIEEMVRENNGLPPSFLAENSPLAWCYGRKRG